MSEVHLLYPSSVQPWRVEALLKLSQRELGDVFGGEEATDWLDAAAACGLAEAQLRLGRMLLSGEGMPVDRRAAFACFLAGADGRNAEAQNLLGRCYENGWGTPVDRRAARNCYRLAAENGDFRGAHNHACVLAAEGCIAGALHWFGQAVAGAPPVVRARMLEALEQHPRCAIRAFALREHALP